jgi:uncharacterized protein
MFLDNYKTGLSSLCQDANVKNLYAFVSVLIALFIDLSDIDLLVEEHAETPALYVNSYFTLKFSLEQLLNRSIPKTMP